MPKQVDQAERRQAMSEAVWRVVSERGLDGLTLRAVAAAAGCTTGMVTHYFRDKKALLAHARSVMHRRMADRIDALSPQGAARETLRSVAEQALPLDPERRLEAVVWAYFQLSNRTDPDLLRHHTASHASWVRRLTGLVRDALPRPEPADLEWRVRSLVACLDGLALNAVTDPGAYPPELQRRVLATHLDLILETPEGNPAR
ncbi:TetR/AcrR family transcriptional regulator [Nonomuraea basaltis]|uniref:TetR/AcrR family transcriptional regulator n=1 Tax=Nonomuraea basaltis TaxID=2495887 RepID=UPI00110C6D1F|nr:TetR/AcrR family transcriptional regulator [Nonomuraea basaltis]TMR92351.1 TetR/AcrR family transcriptional regulator [Nonomuraea basaltis]